MRNGERARSHPEQKPRPSGALPCCPFAPRDGLRAPGSEFIPRPLHNLHISPMHAHPRTTCTNSSSLRSFTLSDRHFFRPPPGSPMPDRRSHILFKVPSSQLPPGRKRPLNLESPPFSTRYSLWQSQSAGRGKAYVPVCSL